MVSGDKLKVLMIENSVHDAEQIVLLLARSGFQTEYLQIIVKSSLGFSFIRLRFAAINCP